MFSDEKQPEEEIIVDTSDVTGEPEIEAIEEADEQKATKLRKQLKDCQAEKQAAQDELQRVKADFLNARRRLEEAREADRKRAEVAWIEKLLPLCDSFQMAMSNTETWEAVDANWRVGVEGIHAQLRALLEEHKVTVIDPIDQPFDPNEHEALGTEAAEGKDSDVVLRVIQSGYKQGDMVIRPAKVIITS